MIRASVKLIMRATEFTLSQRKYTKRHRLPRVIPDHRTLLLQYEQSPQRERRVYAEQVPNGNQMGHCATFATAESLPITASNGSRPPNLLPHSKPGVTS